MELLNISLSLNKDGTVTLDSIIGRDVSFQPYPGPDVMEVLHTCAGLSPSRAFRPDLLATPLAQAVLWAPALLGELSSRLQEVVERRPESRLAQLSLFS